MTGYPCPGCGEYLPPAATWCFGCRAYLSDLSGADERQEPLSPTKAGTVPDDRSEQEIRLAIRKALDLSGYAVYDTEQGYRKDGSTRVTKGLADLLVLGNGRMLFVEVKSAKGRLTEPQKAFARHCEESGTPHRVWRSEAEAIEWIQDNQEAT